MSFREQVDPSNKVDALERVCAVQPHGSRLKCTRSRKSKFYNQQHEFSCGIDLLANCMPNAATKETAKLRANKNHSDTPAAGSASEIVCHTYAVSQRARDVGLRSLREYT